MGTINLHNYQAFILDYHEGNLTAEQAAELLLFIENNPSLKAEFEEYEPVTLPPASPDVFPAKDSLLRNITEETVSDYLVANLEGDLSPADAAELESFLAAQPRFRKDEKLFALTRIKPDRSVVFPNKRLLKKPVPLARSRRIAYYYYAAAASIVLLIGAYFITRTSPEGTQLAGRAPAIEKKMTTPPADVLTDTRKPAEQQAPARAIPKPLQTPKSHPPKKNNPPVKPQPAHEDVPLDTEPANPSVLPIAGNENPESVASAPVALAPGIATELIREKLADEIRADPTSFDGAQFDAFLDRVTNPDSSLSNADFERPVFASKESPAPAVQKNAGTPVLNALAWGISKVTDDVKLRKNYDQNGELVAYNLEAGKLKFGRSEGK